MLSEHRALVFVPVNDIDRAMHFYVDVLGLTVTDSGTDHCSLQTSGLTVRLHPVVDRPVNEYTLIGWSVPNVSETAAELIERGLTFNRYDGIRQDQYGVWTAPNGDQTCWFCDPDENTLSITQFV